MRIVFIIIIFLKMKFHSVLCSKIIYFVLFVCLFVCFDGLFVWLCLIFVVNKTYPLNSNVCFAIAFECVLLGLIGYLIRPLPPCCCLLLAPPGVPPALLPTRKGDVDRDRDDPYAAADDDADADGGTGELD